MGKAFVAMLIIVACCAELATAQAPQEQQQEDPLLAMAVSCVANRKLPQFAAEVERELEPVLVDLSTKPDYDRLTQLVALREFGRYFGRLNQQKLDGSQVEALQWIVRKPKLLSTLMMAVSDKDAPDQVLSILMALRADQKDRLEEFPDLVAALCVVWDVPSEQAHGLVRGVERDETQKIKPILLMRYYANVRTRLRFDPQQMPWQLSAYVVDNLASSEEIAWAFPRYSGRGAIGSAFFDVPYDYERFGGYSGAQQRGEDEYTLQDILQRGGICGDQAYFAAHVARACGVPAAICMANGMGDGTGHAWVGYLGVRGRQNAWNFEEGRYAEYQNWRGDVVDPQTRERISDADVALLAELMTTSPRQRLASDALVKVADQFDTTRQAAVFMQAINLCPGNPRAWNALADLGPDKRLSPEQLVQVNGVVANFAARQYPDFAFSVLRRAIAGRGNAQQLAALEDMRKLFASRLDLQASIGTAKAEIYVKEKRYREAMGAYGNVLERANNLGPVVLETMKQVEQLLRDTNNLPLLAQTYETVWKRMPVPQHSIAVGGTPYFLVGSRYLAVLEDVGDSGGARAVQSRLDSLTGARTARPPRR